MLLRLILRTTRACLPPNVEERGHSYEAMGVLAFGIVTILRDGDD